MNLTVTKKCLAPVWLIALLGLSALINGCASVPITATDSDNRELAANEQTTDPDPWEGMNRRTFKFNKGFDRMLLDPAARGIKRVTPDPIDRGVSNFFGNISDVGTGINNLLQGKVGHAVSDTGRVAINSTLGIAGVLDVASGMNLQKHNEDFGQTLGKWGMKQGPFVVLPFFGPSTIRDTVGLVSDSALDPVTYIKDDAVRVTLFAGKVLEKRASLLQTTDLLDQAALDPYLFERDAYLQKREFDVNDGELLDEDF